MQVQLEDGMEVLGVIDQNFPTFPDELTKTISHETEGFLSLAVELAVELQRGQNPPINTLNEAHALLNTHLDQPEDRQAVLAVTLLEGHPEGIQHLEGLGFLGPDWEKRLERLEKTVPFLQKNLSGWKVHPPFVEGVAFQGALTEIALDPELFMSVVLISEDFKVRFLRQASKYASMPDRQRLGWLQWSAHRDQHDPHFVDVEKTVQLTRIVQTDPPSFLPQVCYLQSLPRPNLDEATVSGTSNATVRWLDLLAYCMLYPDLAEHAEVLLVDRMDTDPRVQVKLHARKHWSKAMALPGRSVLSAGARLQRLTERWSSQRMEDCVLVLETLVLALRGFPAGIESFAQKPGGQYPAVYQPAEWEAFTGQCWVMLIEVARFTRDPEQKEKARNALRAAVGTPNKRVRQLMASDVSLLLDVLSPEEILQVEGGAVEVRPRKGKPPELPVDWETLGFMQKVQRFSEGEVLFPHQSLDEPAWKDLLTELGDGMMRSTSALQEALAVLRSQHNTSVQDLARHLARQADPQVFLTELLQDPVSVGSSFGVAYLEALLERTADHDDAVLQKMQDWEETLPKVVMSMLRSRIDRLGGLQRMLQLAESHQIPLERLPSAQMNLTLHDAHLPEYVQQVLAGNDEEAKDWLVHVLYYSHVKDGLTPQKLQQRPALVPVVASVLGNGHSHLLKRLEVLEIFLPDHPERVLDWLLDHHTSVSGYDQSQLLKVLVENHAEAVLGHLEKRWAEGSLSFKNHAGLIVEVLLHLPTEQAVTWLRSQPQGWVLQVASVLPEPHATVDGVEIPALTLAMLEEMDADPTFQHAFCGNRNNAIQNHPESGRPIWLSFLASPWMTLRRWAATLGGLPVQEAETDNL